MGSGPKNHKEMVFLGFSHITALYRFPILLQCFDDTQTYRIVAHFNLKGGKTKIEPQNSSQFLFTTSEISRVSRSWFSLRETLAHSSPSYFYCIASIALKFTVESPSCLRKVRQYEKGQLYQKRMGSGPKNHKEMFFFWGFHTLLHYIAPQFYCSALMILKLTG